MPAQVFGAVPGRTGGDEPFAPRPSVRATGHPSHSRTLGLAASDSFCRDRPALRHTTSLSLARAFAQ